MGMVMVMMVITMVMVMGVVMGDSSSTTSAAATAPLTQPGSTLRVITGPGLGFAICYIASNSSLICLQGGQQPVSGMTPIVPFQYPPAGTTYTSLSGSLLVLCGLTPQGAASCFSGSGYGQIIAQPPYQVFSAITYGSTGGCGLLAASGLAQCWYPIGTPPAIASSPSFLSCSCHE